MCPEELMLELGKLFHGRPGAQTRTPGEVLGQELGFLAL